MTASAPRFSPCTLLLGLFGLLLPGATAHAADALWTVDRDELVFSATRGATSPVQIFTLTAVADAPITLGRARIEGPHAQAFRLATSPPAVLNRGARAVLEVVFRPDMESLGVLEAVLRIPVEGDAPVSIGLYGLSTRGLEGSNEPSLAEVVHALGYRTDVGWTTLGGPVATESRGAEIEQQLFRKAGPGPVTMQPVARFSPDFPLPFGYYTVDGPVPALEEVGVLAEQGDWPEHQTLFPGLGAGGTTFDPGPAAFGFYTTSPTHTAYSEDRWNKHLHRDHAPRAVRTYPFADREGRPLPNAYVVCFEEASNGDYQDYVFVVRNVLPIDAGTAYGLPAAEEVIPASAYGRPFRPLFNGQNLDGWTTFLRDIGRGQDPDGVFTVGSSLLRVSGETFGYVMTDETFADFHLRLEYRWGDDMHVPDAVLRNSGILYRVPEDVADETWPLAIECQLQETNAGDYWLFDGATVVADGAPTVPSDHTRVTKKVAAERPRGEWNTVEVIANGGTTTHIVNGIVVNRTLGASLRIGRILLQSEGAELFFRNVEIRTW